MRDRSWDEPTGHLRDRPAIRAAKTRCPQQGLSLGAKPLVRTGLLTGVTHAWVLLGLTLILAAGTADVSPWVWEGRDILQFPWLQTSD